MGASENTKFQVNFKSPDGTLINLYAANKEELEALLTAAQDFSALIGSVSQSFSGARTAAPVYTGKPQSSPEIGEQFPPARPAAGNSDRVTDQYGNVWTYNLPEAPECPNGKMALKEGLTKLGKPFKGWYDPAAGPLWTGAKIPKTMQTQPMYLR